MNNKIKFENFFFNFKKQWILNSCVAFSIKISEFIYRVVTKYQNRHKNRRF